MSWKFKYYNESWSVLRDRFDWVSDMKGVPQSPIHHAEGDVDTLTQMVIHELINLSDFKDLSEQDQHILYLSALMHDMEKRSTTVIETNGEITSKGHSRKGENSARTVMYKDLDVPFEIREQVSKLVRYHGLPLWALEKRDKNFAVIEASQYVDTKKLAILAKADMLGRICQDKEEMLFKIDLFEELCINNDCYGKARKFTNDLTRFTYLNSSEPAMEYVPFDDTKFTVYVMVGLPGAGKDTYISNHLNGIEIVSIDDIRRKNKADARDSKENGRAVQETKELAKKHLRTGESFIWNGTNITRDMRSMVISLFLERFNPKCNVKIIYIETPYKTLLKQNLDRQYPIPTPALEKLIRKFEMPTFNEAHSIEIILNS